MRGEEEREDRTKDQGHRVEAFLSLFICVGERLFRGGGIDGGTGEDSKLCPTSKSAARGGKEEEISPPRSLPRAEFHLFLFPNVGVDIVKSRRDDSSDGDWK